MVLDIGEPVTILSVAKRMISMSGKRDVEISFTGLRAGEKLHEALFGEHEHPEPTEHPLIRSVYVPPLDPAELEWFHRWDHPVGAPSPADASAALLGSAEPASWLQRNS